MIYLREKGATLIVVLLLLVAMMLMGFALMRSVDMAGLISGNVAFKQAATQAGDVALVDAEALLATIGNNPTASVNGYASTSQSQDETGLPCVRAAAGSSSYTCAISPAVTPPADFYWVPATPVPVVNGLSYQYAIERMCDSNGNCVAGPSISSAVSNCSAGMNKPECMGSSNPPVQYRITARIVGPKDLTTYVQGFYSR